MRVEVRGLVKRFQREYALRSVSFSFESGQVVGFIGPNGAGKTTTMRIMSTLMEPTRGDVFFDGVSATQYPETVRRHIGFMPDSLPDHKDMSVHEYLDFFARAYQIRGEERRQILEQVEEFTGLMDFREKNLSALSKGMRQRVSLGRAIIHDPDVLILDEPAAGLDPRARIELRELILALAEQGKAILISSHILSELAEIVDHAVVIEKGRIRFAGNLEDVFHDDDDDDDDEAPHQAAATPADLESAYGPNAGETAPTQEPPAKKPRLKVAMRPLNDVEGLRLELLQSPYISKLEVNGRELEMTFKGTEEECCYFIRDLITKGFLILEFHQKRARLEDVFMKLTRGELQ